MSKNNFRSNFMEISKAVHFWKGYNVRNPKTNVYICAETQVAAILDFGSELVSWGSLRGLLYLLLQTVF